jgi:hypothetical protein
VTFLNLVFIGTENESFGSTLAASLTPEEKATNDLTMPLPGFDIVKPFKFAPSPYEYKVTPLRECPTPESLQNCDTPQKAADYWRMHVPTHPYFNPDCECFVVLMLNTRRKVKGHHLVSIGTLDTILVHPREVFRLAIMTAASAIILVHNLCAAAHKLC